MDTPTKQPAPRPALTDAQRAEINRTIDQALSAVQLLCRIVDRPSPIATRKDRRTP